MSERVSEAFMLVVELGLARGARRINELPGCWECALGRWLVAVNGHSTPREMSRGLVVQPFTAYVERDGLPAAVLRPDGGTTVAGVEDELIEALRAELARKPA